MTQYQFLQPFTFKNGVAVKNRIAIAPMTTSSALADVKAASAVSFCEIFIV